jgi:hypothetical protein
MLPPFFLRIVYGERRRWQEEARRFPLQTVEQAARARQQAVERSRKLVDDMDQLSSRLVRAVASANAAAAPSKGTADGTESRTGSEGSDELVQLMNSHLNLLLGVDQQLSSLESRLRDATTPPAAGPLSPSASVASGGSGVWLARTGGAGAAPVVVASSQRPLSAPSSPLSLVGADEM